MEVQGGRNMDVRVLAAKRSVVRRGVRAKLAKAMKRRRTIVQQVRDTDLPTKVYRSITMGMIAVILAGGAWFLNDLSQSVRSLAVDMADMKGKIGVITYIQSEQGKKLDSLEKKVEGLRK